jgi:hypothetical protein
MTASSPPVDMRGAHTHHHLRGSHGRLRHRLLIYFVGGFAVILGLGALGTILGGPKQHLCRPYKPCGVPKAMAPLVNETVWRSSRYGYTLEYPGEQFHVAQQGPTGVFLTGGAGAVIVQAFSGATLDQAIRTQVTGLGAITQVATDTLPADQVLGAGVGLRPGVGGVYTGFLAAPQGVGQNVSLASEAASAHGLTISVTVVGVSSASGPHSGLYQLGDSIVNSIRWPGGRG